MMWSDIFEKLYKDYTKKSTIIADGEDFIDVLCNIALYYHDVMWELYFESFLNEDKEEYFKLDCKSKFLKGYTSLMKSDGKKFDP